MTGAPACARRVLLNPVPIGLVIVGLAAWMGQAIDDWIKRPAAGAV